MEEARPDYVTICTPHFSHTSFAIEAMRRGIHVLVEKPLTVSASAADECLPGDARDGNEAGRRLPSAPPYRAPERCLILVQSGFVGRIQRVTIVRTAWFRSMAYYRSTPGGAPGRVKAEASWSTKRPMISISSCGQPGFPARCWWRWEPSVTISRWRTMSALCSSGRMARQAPFTCR